MNQIVKIYGKDYYKLKNAAGCCGSNDDPCACYFFNKHCGEAGDICLDGYYFKEVQSQVNELTQRDLQVLSAMLKEQIDFYEKVLPDYKANISSIFHRCDPENKGTYDWFESLNYNKDMQRNFRNRKNKLAEIQRKIKRQIANG